MPEIWGSALRVVANGPGHPISRGLSASNRIGWGGEEPGRGLSF
jgi:hypothetical protein